MENGELKMEKYEHSYSLTAADMDTRYRMTPNAVLLYYQDCWARYMSCLRMAAFDMVKQQRMWVITEFNAWMEQQTAYWSTDVRVSVWNSEISALRLYAEFRVEREDGVEVAHGYGCWTLLDTDSHRLAPLTPYAEQIPIVAQMTSETHRKMRFPTEGETIEEFEHRVNPINLDFNGHVNNRTYLSIAMQKVDEQVLDENAIRMIAIHWLRESFLGDTLKCRLAEIKGDEKEVKRYLHTISREEGVSAQIYAELEPRRVKSSIDEEASRV